MLIFRGRKFQDEEEQMHRPQDEKELLYSRDNREASVAASQKKQGG